MRVERVYTHHRCNQACTFCTYRRPSDEPGFARTAAVRERIAAAIRGGASEIVLTGGEPAMRTDLVELIRFAAQAGAAVTLETNATLIDLQRARDLREAGLKRARVHVIGDGPEPEEVSQDPGGSARTWVGLRALVDAGVAVTPVTVLTQATQHLLPLLPAALARVVDPSALAAIEVVVPSDLPRTAAAPSVDLGPAELAAALQRVDDEAKRLGLSVCLAPASGPPPCAFEHHGRIAHLYALSPGGAVRADHRRVAACSDCLVADRCPGWPQHLAKRAAAIPLFPVQNERLRRRLSVIDSVQSQVERELVVANFLNTSNLSVSERAAGLQREHLIRVI